MNNIKEKIKTNFTKNKIYILAFLVIWVITVSITLFAYKDTLGKESSGNSVYDHVAYFYNNEIVQTVDTVDESKTISLFLSISKKDNSNIYVKVVGKDSGFVYGGILLLVLGSPFMLISIIIIKLQDGGDVFFKQTRLTKDGREFEMIKFRSMVMNAEPEGKMIKAKENDPRITKYGKFIRATRIDELPQVINILKGEMSFVGPRALRIEEYKENEKEFPEFKYRLKVQAGLTGYAQLYGKYNTSFRDKLLFDMYYIENYSLIEDIKLILMSFVNIFIKDSTQGF